MKIVKLFIVIICLGLFGRTKAQSFLVGDTMCNHTVLNYTPSFPPLSGSLPSSYSVNYSVDVDGDVINDINFHWLDSGVSSSPSGSYHVYKLKCTSSNNYEFVYFPTPTNCNSSPQNYLSNLAYLSPMASSLNWSLTPSSSFLYDIKHSLFSSYNCGYYGNPNIPINVYIGFRKVLTNDTIYGWLLVKAKPGADKIVSYSYKHTLTSTVTPVFTNTAAAICAGSSLSLTANPSGGNFFGPYVTGNTFNSVATSPGTYTIYYSKSCSATTLALVVNPLPITAFTNSLASLCNGESLTLTATPAGGVFSGTGVSGNTFNSLITGLGTTPVNYQYTDANGCSNNSTLNLNVVSVPNLSISSTSSLSCPGHSIILTAGGASNYTWSTGSISNTIIALPNTSTNYSVSGIFATGSCPTASINFLQPVGSPTLTINGPTTPVCPSHYTSSISVSGAASYLWSNSSTSPSITVYQPFAPSYSVIGLNPGGCGDTAYYTFNVTAPIINVTPNWANKCPGDPVIFFGTGGTGIYKLYDSGGAFIMSISTPSFVLIPANYYELRNYYSSADTITCYASASFSSHDVYCVGIHELINNKGNLNIFPNPNAGEFEIMGVSEETILISNELGQVMKTIQLTSENNFSFTINDLNSGVYFVGNKSFKQKIVVIK